MRVEAMEVGGVCEHHEFVSL